MRGSVRNASAPRKPSCARHDTVVREKFRLRIFCALGVPNGARRSPRAGASAARQDTYSWSRARRAARMR
ncbi:hypothetical protein FTUN_1588 [Frigoriglobus tundricola]|uniref:Uncharacterized protein n=1 Tax=Frigoriglobus tundricola TaxID=2774151 RepID=A0A6M5YJ40_9BACT|nr:hypothetical protein FTUN_1588 [Frigoriglobus tundricola]